MGIPLVALQARQPEAPDLIGPQVKAMQLRQLAGQQQMLPGELQQQQQQIQQGQVQAQLQQRALKDQDALTKAYQDWDGKDYQNLTKSVIENGGSGAAAQKLQADIIGMREKASTIAKNDAAANTDNANAQIRENDQYRGRILSIADAPAEQKQNLWTQERNAEIQNGKIQANDPNFPEQVPPDGTLKIMANHFALGSLLQKEANEQTTQERLLQEAKNTATNQAQQRKDAEASLSERTRHDKAIEGIQSGAAAGQLSKEAQDQAAQRYSTTGQLPPTGRGPAGLAQTRAIINRSAELNPGQVLAENSAEFKANQSSLTGLQKNFDMVTAFENTAGKNLDIYLNAVKKLDDTGSPWLNKPWREVQAGAAGNPDIAAANTARATALTEIAKVLNSSNASGVLSDSARAEVSGLIGPNSTLKQVESAATILKQDMANRHQSYQDQIGDIKKRLGGATPQAGAQGGGQASAAGAPSAPPAGATHTGVSSLDGKKYWLDANGKKLGPA